MMIFYKVWGDIKIKVCKIDYSYKLQVTFLNIRENNARNLAQVKPNRYVFKQF